MAAVMNRSQFSILILTLSNKRTHLSKQIRDNAIWRAETVVSTLRRRSPIELCREIEGGETDGGGYDLQSVSIGTRSAGGGRDITACSYEPQRCEEAIRMVSLPLFPGIIGKACSRHF
eukprot:scaffold60796_cov49-Cyclotella_meneghiniana.AAC.1